MKSPIQDYYSTLPVLEAIPSNKLISGQDYQRVVKSNSVRKIVEGFNPMKFTPPTVSFRDGKYYLVDGQHRLCALVYMNGGKPVTVSCLVFHGMNYGDEVNTVVHHDEGHRNLTSLEYINAASKGTDHTSEVIRAFLKANESVGVILVPNTVEKQGNTFVCVKTLLTVYQKYGEKAYKRCMSLHLNTWEGVLDSKKSQIVTALFLFDRTYYGKYDTRKFQKRLCKVSCTQALATAKTLGGSTIDGLVSVFVNTYNRGIPKEYRL